METWSCFYDTVGEEIALQPQPQGVHRRFSISRLTAEGIPFLPTRARLTDRTGMEGVHHVTGEAHALSHEGSRYFGLLAVETPGRAKRDYTWTVGLRNSHDKSYPAGLVARTRVFVCENLSFCRELTISRKHTRHAARDLKHLTARAVGQLGDKFHHLDRRTLAHCSISMYTHPFSCAYRF